MKTKARKLTVTEARARAFCGTLNQYDGGEIGIEWKKSRMWGHNPVITYHGGKCTNIGGCGYDKLSAALASVLCFLFPEDSEAFNTIAALGGCGESTVREKLLPLGWKLERTASGSSFDGYRLTRAEGKEGK
jgi:hypothetical protein